MKILVISHNCVLATAQERLAALAALTNEKPALLVPPRNLETQGMVELEKTHDERYDIIRGRPLLSMVLGKRYFQFYPELRRVLLDVKPDVIDMHEEPWSLVAFHTLALRNALLPRTKVVVETEQNIFKRFPPPFNTFERFVLSNVDTMIARNSEITGVLRRKNYTGRIEVVANGLDTNLFRPARDAELRERLGLRNFTAGFIGKIGEEKGIEELLRAGAAADSPIDLLIVGDGPDAGALRGIAGGLNFKGRVVWLPAVDQKEIPRHLGCMDALVLPSRTASNWKEQFGRVLVEAMACGAAVVGSDSGAIPEVIGDAGLIFHEGDHLALKSALEELAGSPGRREELVRRGAERVERLFSWSAVAGKLMGIFRELVK